MYDGLLEYLSSECGCMFLSDLRRSNVRFKLDGPLEKVEEDSYSLSEWQEAVYYILGNAPEFSNVNEAKKYLLEQIRLG